MVFSLLVLFAFGWRRGRVRVIKFEAFDDIIIAMVICDHYLRGVDL